MDFFAHQDRAKTRTFWLVFLFLSSVALIVTAVCLIFVVALPELFYGSAESSGAMKVLVSGDFRDLLVNLDWASVGAVAAGVIVAIGLASLYKTMVLKSGGGRALAEAMGGRLIDSGTSDPQEKRLVNIIEEMALASGIPVPEIYVLDHEQNLNAFAAGLTVHSAVIGVTGGLLKKLDRDELQGVIAHEIGHIVQGDMSLNLRLIGILFGILFLQQVGYLILRGTGGSSRGRRGSSGGIVLVGLGLLLLGSIGYLFGALIKAAVSRQREFFADASAVQFTRYPAGLSGALKKIGSLGSLVTSSRAPEVSHMFIARGVSGLFASAFATHPSIQERIARIEGIAKELVPGYQPSQSALATESLSDLGGTVSSFTGSAEPPPLRPRDLIEKTGKISAGGISLAATFLKDLPEEILVNAADPYSARCLVFAVMMSSDPTERQAQIEALGCGTSRAEQLLTLSLWPKVSSLGKRARLPIVDLSMPSLKRLTPIQLKTFLDSCYTLIKADSKIDVFEYVLFRLLQLQLRSKEKVKTATQTVSLSAERAVAVALGALASQGQGSAAASAAYAEGAREFGVSAEWDDSLGRWDPATFDGALKKIDTLTFNEKGRFMLACATVIAHDGQVTIEEAEIVRVISSFLGCPIPAFH